MNRTVIGAILLFILITLGAVAVKFITPFIEESRLKSTSDSAKVKGKIRIDLDNWIGYFPLRSREMKKLLHQQGYNLEVTDDNADYSARIKRLDDGKADFSVATVDSYVLNGIQENYPGTIIMVIDESKGGDAILARKDSVSSLDSLKGKSVKVAFTPDSPSHHLAKAASDHFGITALLPTGDNLIKTDGSSAACDKLLSGKTDVAICWEPDVSRALENDGVIKLLGTEDTQRLIVDILIVNRKFADKEADVVDLFLNTYFKVLKKYRDDPALLKKHVKKETGLQDKMVESMLKGVSWVNFSENCDTWYGISAPGESSDEGLVDTIDSTVSILTNTGDFSASPIPDNDPYRLINSSFLESIFNKRFSGFTKPGSNKAVSVNTLGAAFSKLPEKQWNSLKEVGTLKIEPVSFQSGSSELDLLGKEVIDRMAERLKHYPNFRILIKAHTGTKGDKKANLELSQKRADSVDRYLMVTYGIDQNRTHAVGYGGTQPLKKQQGESRRAWSYRLPRVEFSLVREDF